VSVAGNYAGGVPRPKPVRLTTTNQTDIVTGFDKGDILAAFSLANETTTARVVQCYYYDGATDFLIYSGEVPISGTLVVSDIPIRLYSGDKFKCTAAAANAITVTPIIIRSHPNEVANAASGPGIGS
jgi:hypothetical protein